jgi:hypothetical protein
LIIMTGQGGDSLCETIGQPVCIKLVFA